MISIYRNLVHDSHLGSPHKAQLSYLKCQKTEENRPENIKVKGRERNRLKELALQFVRNAGEEGTRRELIIEYLKDTLPTRNTKEQNQRLVGNILVEMSNEGSITQKDRIWFATTNKGKVHD